AHDCRRGRPRQRPCAARSLRAATRSGCGPPTRGPTRQIPSPRRRLRPGLSPGPDGGARSPPRAHRPSEPVQRWQVDHSWRRSCALPVRNGEEPRTLDVGMPELPEVEITARLIGGAIAGSKIESVLTPGINALKTFDPPVSALEGRSLGGIRRRGKLFLIDVEDQLTILIHLMSAGRLQLFETRASLRDKTSRL